MLSLFFVPEITDGTQQRIEGDEAHHIIKVVRMQLGDSLQVTDGAGNWAEGTISEIDKKALTLSIRDRGHSTRTHPEFIVLQALTKSERAKETVELLVEGGVDRIIPWQSDHSIAKWRAEMHEKWSTAVLAACKQSRRYNLPVVEGPITFEDLKRRLGEKSLLLVLHESAREKLSVVVSPVAISYEQIILVVGPEGGISPVELRELESMGGKLVKLGNPVLRSAHAGFAGLAAVQALMKHW